MSYFARKLEKMCVFIALAAIVVFAVIYVCQAQKIQRRRALSLINMYNTGMITQARYEKLRKENSFLKALFNPKD